MFKAGLNAGCNTLCIDQLWKYVFDFASTNSILSIQLKLQGH